LKRRQGRGRENSPRHSTDLLRGDIAGARKFVHLQQSEAPLCVAYAHQKHTNLQAPTQNNQDLEKESKKKDTLASKCSVAALRTATAAADAAASGTSGSVSHGSGVLGCGRGGVDVSPLYMSMTTG